MKRSQQDVQSNQESSKVQGFTIKEDAIKFSFDVAKSARNLYRKNSAFSKDERSKTFNLLKSTKDNKSYEQVNSARTILNKTTTQLTLPTKNKINNYFDKIKTATLSKAHTRYITSNMSKPSQNRTPHSHTPLRSNSISTQQIPTQNFFKTPTQTTCLKSPTTLLKSSHIQNWLNQTLISSSPNIKFNKEQQNSGLKMYKIDRSSLLKIGLQGQNIERLYRSFFVYSIGFNNLCKDLCNGDEGVEIRKSIWKVFVVLLQYCSDGSLETMIGEIERDKIKKIESLREQIEKRQKVIETKDEQSIQKTKKITKDLVILQSKTKDLQQQHTTLLEQFYETEQAFNQEVTLRLKYETRINQVHANYGELKDKYHLLREQNQKNEKTLAENQRKITGLKNELYQKHKMLETAQNNIQTLLQQNRYYKVAYQDLQQNHKVNMENYFHSKTEAANLSTILAERNRIIQNYELTVNSMQSTQKAMQLLLKSKGEEFQRAMKENSLLHDHMQNNLEDTNRIVEEKREIGYKTAQVTALMALQVQKFEKEKEKLKVALSDVGILSQNLELKEIDLCAEKQKTQSLQKDTVKLAENIQTMHLKHNELSDLLTTANRQISMLSQTLQKRENTDEKHSKQSQRLKTKIEQLKVQVAQKQSKLEIVQQSLKVNGEIWVNRCEKLEQQNDWLKKRHNETEKEKEQIQQQLNRIKQNSDKIYDQLKNEKFQRNSLDLYYKQSLLVLEEEIQHIKKQNIQISELNESLDNYKRKYNNVQYLWRSKFEVVEKQKHKWQGMCKDMEQKLYRKSMHIHPMIHEQVCANLIEMKEYIVGEEHKQQKYVKKIKKLQLSLVKMQQQIKMNQNKSEGGDINKQKLMDLSKKQQQLSFLRHKMEYQQSKLQDSQLTLQKVYRQKQSVMQMLRKSESEFVEKLKDKNKQLKQMNEKYQGLLKSYENELQISKNVNEKPLLQSKQLQSKVDFLLGKTSSKQVNRNQKSPTSRSRKSNFSSKNDVNRNNEQNDSRYEQSLNEQVILCEISELKQSYRKKESGSPSKNEGSFIKREEMKRKIKDSYIYYSKN